MSITEFLMARIADDEERARFVDSQHDEWARRQRWEPWRLSWQDEYDLLCIDPTRAIAECEAKRRMVDFIFTEAESVDGEWGDNHNAAEIRAGKCSDQGGKMAEQGLAILAAAYVDHPDYDEAWRA